MRTLQILKRMRTASSSPEAVADEQLQTSCSRRAEVLIPRWWETRKGKNGFDKVKDKNNHFIQTKMDLVATPDTGGGEDYVDVTYRHPLADSHVEATARNPIHMHTPGGRKETGKV